MSAIRRYQVQISILILAVGAIWIVLSSIFFLPEIERSISVPQKGFLAPDFKLGTSQGLTLNLSDLRGQVILLNIWASWCAPCKAEMPAMQNIYEEYKNQGFTILAVNSTHQDSVGAAMQFASRLNLTFPILLDMDGIVSSSYQVKAFPTSFFIDRNGIIQDVFVGGPMLEAYLQAQVEDLLSR